SPQSVASRDLPSFPTRRSSDLPPGFQHPVMAELWTPVALTPEQAAAPEPRFLRLVARLKTGVSLSEAQTAVDRVSARLARERKEDRKSTRLNSSHEWSSYPVFC